MPVLTAASLAAETPRTRDRWLDFLRVASIAVVVLGHWLMAAVTWGRDGVETGNLLAVVPGLQALTWLLQVMPLFFFVGGVANAGSWRSATARGDGYAEFIRRRLDRLVRPVWPLLAVWLVVAVVLSVAGADSSAVRDALLIVVQPLWFLALYVVVVALTPVTLGLHERRPFATVVALVALVVVADVARLGFGVEPVKYLNYVVVWVLAHQAGYFYRDGRLLRVTPRTAAVTAAAAFGLLGALTTAGPYPVSMVGLPGRTSNMSPPTAAIVVLTVALVAMTLLLCPAAAPWLQRPRVWVAVVVGNTVLMTVFLWHLTALVIVTALLSGLGLPWPPIASAGWWLLRVPWLALLALVLAGLVAVMRRFEQPSAMPADRPPHPAAPRAAWTVVAATAAIYVVLGLSGLALAGLRGIGTGRGIALLHLHVGAELSVAHLALGAVLAGAVARAAPRRVVLACAGGFVLLATAAAVPQGVVHLDLASAVTQVLTAAVLVAAVTRAG